MAYGSKNVVVNSVVQFVIKQCLTSKQLKETKIKPTQCMISVWYINKNSIGFPPYFAKRTLFGFY